MLRFWNDDVLLRTGDVPEAILGALVTGRAQLFLPLRSEGKVPKAEGGAFLPLSIRPVREQLIRFPRAGLARAPQVRPGVVAAARQEVAVAVGRLVLRGVAQIGER